MKDKYSLRVELEHELELKLRRIAAGRGVSLAKLVRDEILTIPDASPVSFEEWTSEFSRTFEKLYYWTTKRLCRGTSRWSDVPSHVIEDEIKNYVFGIVYADSDTALRSAFDHWDKILTYQEKTALRSFFPFRLPSNHLVEWFQESNWYNLANGEYVILQEPEIEGFSYQGKTVGIITKNSYDADILNAANMAIIDVDLEGNSSLPTDPVVTRHKSVALAALKAYQSEHSELGFRVYKTAAGLRYICTTKEFNPASYESSGMMRNLLADPKYQGLCRFQETYRARLTPKPWRSYDDNYDYRVCELLEIVGDQLILPQFQEMIEYHDRVTDAEIPGCVLA